MPKGSNACCPLLVVHDFWMFNKRDWKNESRQILFLHCSHCSPHPRLQHKTLWLWFHNDIFIKGLVLFGERWLQAIWKFLLHVQLPELLIFLLTHTYPFQFLKNFCSTLLTGFQRHLPQVSKYSYSLFSESTFFSP